MTLKLKGIMPAIASPCNEKDEFLEDVFAQLAASLYKQGVDGVYLSGYTGDGYSMSLEERKRAMEIAVEISKEYNGTVIAHVGTLDTRSTIELACYAAKTGADAISSMPPVNTNYQQLTSYYTDIANASNIPLLVYHLPSITHHEPTLDNMLELLDIEGVIGLKLSSWNLFFMKRLRLARPDIVIFSGLDEFLMPGLLFGANGGIGTWYNLIPKYFIELYKAVNQKDLIRAVALQDLFLAFIDCSVNYGILPTFDLLMAERGFGPYCRRKPRIELKGKIWEKASRELNAHLANIEEEL